MTFHGSWRKARPKIFPGFFRFPNNIIADRTAAQCAASSAIILRHIKHIISGSSQNYGFLVRNTDLPYINVKLCTCRDKTPLHHKAIVRPYRWKSFAVTVNPFFGGFLSCKMDLPLLYDRSRYSIATMREKTKTYTGIINAEATIPSGSPRMKFRR